MNMPQSLPIYSTIHPYYKFYNKRRHRNSYCKPPESRIPEGCLAAVIGVPGHSFAYTVTSSKATSYEKIRAFARTLSWARRQSKPVRIPLPPRDAEEPEATVLQIATIRSLVRFIDPKALKQLGRRQATAVINLLGAEREQFTSQKIREYQNRTVVKRAFLQFSLILLLTVFIAATVYLSSSST